MAKRKKSGAAKSDKAATNNTATAVDDDAPKTIPISSLTGLRPQVDPVAPAAPNRVDAEEKELSPEDKVQAQMFTAQQQLLNVKEQNLSLQKQNLQLRQQLLELQSKEFDQTKKESAAERNEWLTGLGGIAINKDGKLVVPKNGQA